MNFMGRTSVAGHIVLSLLAGCSYPYTSEVSPCIPPNVTNGYDLTVRRQDETSVPWRMQMPRWWEPQLNIVKGDFAYLIAANDVTARSGDEIWIAGYPDAHGNAIVRFDPETRQVEEYAVQDKNGKAFIADNLLVASDGSLWARLTMLGTVPTYSELARYDATTDEFVTVTDREGLLSPVTSGGVHNIFPRRSVLFEVPHGNLVAVLDGEIYTYDPVTNEAKRVLGHSSGLQVASIAVSNDGHVWFVTSNDLSIRELDPETGMVWNYGPPPGISRENPDDQLDGMDRPLVADHEGRVWVADFGWLEQSDPETRYAWHPIPRSSVFLSIYDPEYLYKWVRPFGVYQFSDEDLWFQSTLGIVRFDENADRWCWVATQSGPMAEDENGNLWLVDQQIYRYKYKLHP